MQRSTAGGEEEGTEDTDAFRTVAAEALGELIRSGSSLANGNGERFLPLPALRKAGKNHIISRNAIVFLHEGVGVPEGFIEQFFHDHLIALNHE